jgi:hypothetical protein
MTDDACEVPLALARPVRQGPHWAVFELLPRTTFSFGAVMPGRRLSYELGLPVPVARWPECQLVLRLHDSTLAGTGARATLVCELASRCRDEPATAFVWALPLASARIDADSTIGSAMFVRLRSDVGPLVRARLHLDQASVPATPSVTLSAELLARAPAGAGAQACPCEAADAADSAAAPEGGWR